MPTLPDDPLQTARDHIAQDPFMWALIFIGFGYALGIMTAPTMRIGGRR